MRDTLIILSSISALIALALAYRRIERLRIEIATKDEKITKIESQRDLNRDRVESLEAKLTLSRQRLFELNERIKNAPETRKD